MRIYFDVTFLLCLGLLKLSSAYSCGSLLSGIYGRFYSPGFPSSYRDYLHCTWEIRVNKGFYVNLRFTVFDIEHYTNCSYDYLSVIEKGIIKGRWCGSKTKNESEAITRLKSEENVIEVVFHSDYSNEEPYRGFLAHYSAMDINECEDNNGGCDHLCHNYLGGYYCSCRLHYGLRKDKKTCDYKLCQNVHMRSMQGSISSPEYPNAYPSHLNCSWRITVPQGYRIVLQFLQFEIETHPDVVCPYDYLKIFDGTNSAPLCGNTPPRNISSIKNSLLIKFVTDYSYNMGGFLAKYYTKGVSCPRLVAPENGEMSALGFSYKDEATFSCLDGYIMNGTSSITCQSDGEWDGKPPLCKPVSCGHPKTPHRGRAIVEGITFGQSVSFECDKYYEIEGGSTLTCEADGLWSNISPKCIPVCGKSSLSDESIQNCSGNLLHQQATGPKSLPWNVLIKLDDQEICGGSLLNEFWVITAAHCVVKEQRVLSPSRFTVVLGLYNRSEDDRHARNDIQVGQIFHHRNFNPTSFQGDLALLRLRRATVFSDFIQPICLPEENGAHVVTTPGSRGVVAGWGKYANDSLPHVLKAVCTSSVSTEICREEFMKEGFQITHDMFCAGSGSGRNYICKGDSGGTFAYRHEVKRRWFIGGLVSWGSFKGCERGNNYSVYLNIEHYINWIRSRIVS